MGRALVYFPVLALVVAFSVMVIGRCRRGPLSERLFDLSVTADAALVFAGLVTNPLWPWPGYLGFTNMPDAATLVLIALAAGLRLSPRAATLGALLHAGSLVSLIAIEQATAAGSLAVLPHQYLLYAALVATASAAAILHARWTRSLIEKGARAVIDHHVARRSLDLVMHEHHETKSVLGAVQLRADLLARELDASPSAGCGAHAHALREDVRRLVDRMRSVRRHTYAQLLALDAVSDVPIGDVVRDAHRAIAAAYPTIAIELGPLPSGRARVAGGRGALERALRNLIANACEGDGACHATHVSVRGLGRGDGALELVVEDDGPGMETTLDVVVSKKPEGTGWGLQLVHALAVASGGSLAVARAASGGASVTLVLPAAA
ncbi:MAG: HAMP domain-containing histidine kinase [Deltaproteobacteria bacterium]|nr:HAMP domain-containing histidine kinase [Deltaproteobacteria bacterium]